MFSRLTVISLLLFFLTPQISEAKNTIGGCPTAPKNSVWTTPVNTLPVHPKSKTYIQHSGRERKIHVGSGDNESGKWGMPVNIVSSNQKGVSIPETLYHVDNVLYPIPSNPRIQPPTDSHMVIVQKKTCKLFEFWRAEKTSQGWRAGSAVMWDMRKQQVLPPGQTSANAAGLPILPGLYNRNDAKNKEIKHALSFILPHIQNAYIRPASHTDGRMNDPNYMPMGTRIRLKKTVNLSRFQGQARILARAMQRYGLILSDTSGEPHGGNIYSAYSGFSIGSESAANWNFEDRMSMHNKLALKDFEVVDTQETIVQEYK